MNFTEALFERAEVGMGVVDDSFRFVEVNQFLAESINHIPVNDHLGRTVEEIIGTKNWQPLRPYYEQVLQGESIVDIPFEGIRENDQSFGQCLASFFPIKKDNRVYIGIIIRDVTQQLQNEKQIHDFQDRLEMAQEAGEVGLFYWDLKTNAVWYSKEEKKILGLDENNKVNTLQEWLDVLHPDDVHRVPLLIKKQAKEHLPYESEFRVVHPGEPIKWVRGKGKFSYDKTGKATELIGVNYDISNRKKAEEMLRFKAETSRLLISSTDECDVLQQVCDLAIKYVADWCSVEMLEENGNLKLTALAHKDPTLVKWALNLRQKYPVNLSDKKGTAEVIRTGKPLFVSEITQQMIDNYDGPAELKLSLRKLGMSSLIVVPLTIQKKHVGVLSLVLAESHRHYDANDFEVLQQLGLRASLCLENGRLYSQISHERERMVDLLENVPGVVWETTGVPSDQEAKVTFINAYAKELLGYPLKNWLEKPQFWMSIIHPEDKEKTITELDRFCKLGERGSVRCRWTTKAGKTIWVESLCDPIRNRKGISLGLRIVTVDISNQIQLDRRKDDFIAMASHELKTPLTSLKVFTQVLQSDPQLSQSSKAKQYLKKMENQIDRLNDLVLELLDLARIQNGQLSLEKDTFKLTGLLQEIIDMLQLTCKNQLNLNVKTCPEIFADRHRLSQVFMNLIANAIKYSPEASPIYITIKQCENEAVVSVADSGIGIPIEHQPYIFQRFYRVFDDTDKTFPGFGMGLFIAMSIVKQHQGKMWLESVPHKGSTFYVSLPLTTKEGTA